MLGLSSVAIEGVRAWHGGTSGVTPALKASGPSREKRTWHGKWQLTQNETPEMLRTATFCGVELHTFLTAVPGVDSALLATVATVSPKAQERKAGVVLSSPPATFAACGDTSAELCCSTGTSTGTPSGLPVRHSPWEAGLDRETVWARRRLISFATATILWPRDDVVLKGALCAPRGAECCRVADAAMLELCPRPLGRGCKSFVYQY